MSGSGRNVTGWPPPSPRARQDVSGKPPGGAASAGPRRTVPGRLIESHDPLITPRQRLLCKLLSQPGQRHAAGRTSTRPARHAAGAAAGAGAAVGAGAAGHAAGAAAGAGAVVGAVLRNEMK